MISKDKLDSYIKVKYDVESHAHTVAYYLAQAKIGSRISLDPVDISAETCFVRGEESWPFGGKEYFDFTFPTELLTSENWKNEADKLIEKWVKELAEKQIAERKRLDREKEERERKIYEDLKKKFQ